MNGMHGAEKHSSVTGGTCREADMGCLGVPSNNPVCHTHEAGSTVYSLKPYLLEPTQACCASTGLVGKGLSQFNDGLLGAGLKVFHHGGRVDLLQDCPHLIIKALQPPAIRKQTGQ